MKRFWLYNFLCCLLLSSVTVFAQTSSDLPKFITHSHMDPTKVIRISKFRSTIGHPYTSPPCDPDKYIKCQSEKHYFDFYTPGKPLPDVTAPCTGTISTIREEDMGTQVWITPDNFPDYQVGLFHIRNFTKKPNDRVAAGEKLGTHYTSDTYSDLAVAGPNWVLTSAFLHMTNDLLKQFGILYPEDTMVISQEDRDKNPSPCEKNPSPCRDQMPLVTTPKNWFTVPTK